MPEGAQPRCTVQDDAGHGPVPFPGEEGGMSFVFEQAGSVRQIVEEQQPRRRRHRSDSGVEGHAGAFVGAVSELECRADDRGRKRQHGRCEQQRKVAPQQSGVDPGDPGEQLVVVHPDDTDVGERHQVCQVPRPLGEQVMQCHSAPRRSPEIENQQRDGDSEDTVAESLDTAALSERAAGRTRS